MAKIRKQIRYANVVATLSPVSRPWRRRLRRLGGSDGKRIKKSSIAGNRLKPDTLHARGPVRGVVVAGQGLERPASRQRNARRPPRRAPTARLPQPTLWP